MTIWSRAISVCPKPGRTCRGPNRNCTLLKNFIVVYAPHINQNFFNQIFLEIQNKSSRRSVIAFSSHRAFQKMHKEIVGYVFSFLLIQDCRKLDSYIRRNAREYTQWSRSSSRSVACMEYFQRREQTSIRTLKNIHLFSLVYRLVPGFTRQIIPFAHRQTTATGIPPHNRRSRITFPAR